MTPDQVKRKLAAILSADVKGYSKLMGEDEEWTFRTLNTYKGLIRNLVGEHRGRIVGGAGDSILAEFASVVDAVECAVEIQQVLRAKNAILPETRKMDFRIGINLGDVIEEEDSIYGDGVNMPPDWKPWPSRAGSVYLEAPTSRSKIKYPSTMIIWGNMRSRTLPSRFGYTGQKLKLRPRPPNQLWIKKFPGWDYPNGPSV
jgi:hypothetical protein